MSARARYSLQLLFRRTKFSISCCADLRRSCQFAVSTRNSISRLTTGSLLYRQYLSAEFASVSGVQKRIPGSIALKHKGKLRRMKFDSPHFHALFTDELKTLAALFTKHGYELRIAGGAVRDLLLGIAPADVDFATTATPDQMHSMFEQEKVRILHKAGEKHGTVACRINDKQNFEVTTLRIDVECDGRWAEVQFTTDWHLDANRRDLTINSMFLDLDGTVHDYFNGIEDLKHHRVLFVGDATTRIQEDFLRILRYFRFFGRITEDKNKHDPATLRAIKENANGLESISGERIWTELKKIVIGRFAGAVVRCMLIDCELSKYLAIPSTSEQDVQSFEAFVDEIEASKPSSMTVLCRLFGNQSDLMMFHKRMKLSNAERDVATFILRHRDDIADLSSQSIDVLIDCYQRLILDQIFARVPNGREHVYELVKYHGKASDCLDKLKQWQPPVFPVNGLDVTRDGGVPKGPAVRVVLEQMYALWKQSQYKMTRDELMCKLKENQWEKEINEVLSPKQKRKRQRQKSENEEQSVA